MTHTSCLFRQATSTSTSLQSTDTLLQVRSKWAGYPRFIFLQPQLKSFFCLGACVYCVVCPLPLHSTLWSRARREAKPDKNQTTHFGYYKTITKSLHEAHNRPIRRRRLPGLFCKSWRRLKPTTILHIAPRHKLHRPPPAVVKRPKPFMLYPRNASLLPPLLI